MIHESFKNSYKVENKLLSALTVYNTGAQKCEPLYQWGPGVRDHYLIHYVVSGQGFYQDILAQTIYSLKAGDVFMVFPGREVLYYAHKQDPWEYVWVGFNGTDAKIMAGAAGFSLHRPVIRSCAFGSELHKMLTKIYNCRGNTLASAVDMTGLLYSTLSLFIHDHPTSPSPDGYEIYVHKATDYIHSLPCFHRRNRCLYRDQPQSSPSCLPPGAGAVSKGISYKFPHSSGLYASGKHKAFHHLHRQLYRF